MKNIHVENLKRLAKQHHRAGGNSNFQNGIRFYHSYQGLDPDRLTWWDDVGFVLNDYRVLLVWQHPRMAFEDAIDAESDRLTDHLPHECFMEKGTPIYKAIGASRKKIISTQYESAAPQNWLEQFQLARQQAQASAHFQITPFLKSRWGKCYRIVELCVPLEMRNEDDLQKLVTLARRLLKREVTLSEVFPDYSYTREDWEKEGLHIAGNDLHTHQLAL